MGSNNYGNANITFKYKHTAKAENFNWLLRNITPAGIYSGGAISFVGNNLTLAPFSAIVNSGSDKATSIATVSPIDLTTAIGSVASSLTPYIIMRYTFSNVIANFPDYYQIAEGDIQANDIIFGKAVFVGGVVNSIDYSVATKAPQYNKALQRYDIFCDTFVNGDKINTVLTSNLDEDYIASLFDGGAEFYFSPTINRTADITAGALRQGTEVTFYNSGTANLVITYETGKASTVYANEFVTYKWNGTAFIIKNASFKETPRVSGITTSYAVLDYDDISEIEVDTTAGDVTVTLPLIANNPKRQIKITNVKGTNKVIVQPHATDANKLSGDGLASIWLPKVGNFIDCKHSSVSGFWEIVDERITHQFRYQHHAGFGSGASCIPYYTNVIESVGNLTTISNSSTNGFSFTVKKSGKYSISTMKQAVSTGAGIHGITLNSTQLSTFLNALTNFGTEVLVCSQGNSVTRQTPFCIACITVFLKKGDVIRPHSDTQTPNTLTYSIFEATYIG